MDQRQTSPDQPDTMSEDDQARAAEESDQNRPTPEDAVEEASDDSFPASDPPSFTRSTSD